MEDVKHLLARYLADKVTKEMDKLWEERGLTNETMEQWAEECYSETAPASS